MLTVNQHSGEALPQAWWATAFKQGIGAIEHTCLVLAPWRAPVPMTRAWCLWELLCTEESGAQLTVQLPATETADFRRALVHDFDSIQSSVAAVDVRRAEAFEPADLEMIRGAVEAGVGYSDLNALVLRQLRTWIADSGLEALAELDASERGTSALITNLGRLLQDQGRLDEARSPPMCWTARARCEGARIGYGVMRCDVA